MRPPFLSSSFLTPHPSCSFPSGEMPLKEERRTKESRSSSSSSGSPGLISRPEDRSVRVFPLGIRNDDRERERERDVIPLLLPSSSPPNKRASQPPLPPPY